MLLDFNLSTDTKLSGLAEAPGSADITLPPGTSRIVFEQASCRRRAWRCLCTRRDPLRDAHGSPPVPELWPGQPKSSAGWSRIAGHAAASRSNSAISPAVESIVRKCLAFDPRIDTRALRDGRPGSPVEQSPLKYAPDRSVRAYGQMADGTHACHRGLAWAAS